jgi:hypothetical protein
MTKDLLYAQNEGDGLHCRLENGREVARSLFEVAIAQGFGDKTWRRDRTAATMSHRRGMRQ